MMTAATCAELLRPAAQAIAGMQTEILVLVLAALLHAAIFGKRRAMTPTPAAAKSGRCAAAGAAGRCRLAPANSCSPARGLGAGGAGLQAALQASDWPAALACLQQLTRSMPLPAGALQRLVPLAAQHGGASALLVELRRLGLLHNTLHNGLLEACIKCRDVASAEQVMSDAVASRMADVVTYNTMVKAHLQCGDLHGAHLAIQQMRLQGLQPNCVTFNELLDAIVRTNVQGAWDIIEEMKACGIRPNRITCSIILKCVQSGCGSADRALEVLEDMADDMDEVLLSSALEACIRVSRADLLWKQLRRYRSSSSRRVLVSGAQTYGSIIRAYGFVNDVAGVKETWREMRARSIAPTSITLGCAVEALASNGDPDGAYQLIREGHNAANAVTYCSVLKGFSHQKRFDQVWAVYGEMAARGLRPQFTSVTYNTLVDACSRCGEIGRVPAVLDEMVRQGIQPNKVTYSAIIKGYCHENQLDKAFELVETMKQSEHLRPDEQAYNTLLDGCTRQNMYTRGMELFEEMKAAGVSPSNYTLSILVKLANRARRLEVAFELCEELPRKYNFHLNVHVYSNLVQACVAHHDLPRAVSVVVRMARAGVAPDERCWALLLRGLLTTGDSEAAAGMLRAALGLPGADPRLASLPQARLRSREALAPGLVSEVVEGVARGAGGEALATSLLEDLRRLPGLRLDPRLLARAARRPAPRARGAE